MDTTLESNLAVFLEAKLQLSFNPEIPVPGLLMLVHMQNDIHLDIHLV